MSKIKLIHFPYGEYQVGSVCDLGEEKNNSMVALNRAVFVDDNKEVTIEKAPEEPKINKKKKLISNDLKEQIEEEKSTKDPAVKTSFWDRLK